MKIRLPVSSALFVILIFNCTSKKETELQLQQIDQTTYTSASLVGEWYYSFPFYSSQLTLLKDGTFRYFARGCTGKSYTEGNYYHQGPEIICRSFDKYKKETEPVETVSISGPVSSPQKKRKGKSNKIEYSIDFSQPAMSISYKYPDTSNIYFERARFKLMEGVLCKLDEYGSFTKAKYRREEDGYTLPDIPPVAPVLPDLRKLNK